jgi:hypothetical protein
MVIKMTRISISNLLKKDTKSLLFSPENENNLVVNLAVNRALEARKVFGGMTVIDIPDDPGKTCGMHCPCFPQVLDAK